MLKTKASTVSSLKRASSSSNSPCGRVEVEEDRRISEVLLHMETLTFHLVRLRDA